MDESTEKRGRHVVFFKQVVRLVAGVLFASILACGSYYAVDEGDRGVVTRMGAINRVADPGAHLKLPLVEDVTKISVRTQCVDWARNERGDRRMETYSRDQQLAHISAKVCYRVKTDAESVKTIYAQFKTTEGYDNAVIVPRVHVALKEVFGQYNAVRVIQDRAAFNAQVEGQLRKEIASNNGGNAILVDNVSVQDIAFSKAYEEAVEARMQAQVEVEKVTQNLEREKKAAEIRVTQADADARAVRLRGQAEADAIRARAAALKDSPKLVELTLAEKWDGKLPATMVPGGSVPFLGLK